MKKMFNKIVVAMISALIAINFVGCNTTTGAESAYLATVNDTEPSIENDLDPSANGIENDLDPSANGIANNLEIEPPATDTSAKVIPLATATTTKLVPSAEMLVKAYQEGSWDGNFVEEAGHCFSIDETGRLWVDCEDLWVFPDLPNGEKNVADAIIARNSEGTWVFHQNFEANEFRFELWLRGELVAKSEVVDFVYDAVVSRENGLTCRTYNGVEYTLTVIRDNLIVMSDANTDVNTNLSAPKSFEEETTKLIEKLQKLYWAGEWRGEYTVIDDHHVKIDDNNSSQWNIDNIYYSVNRDVPVTGTDWSSPYTDWAIVDGAAARFYNGQVKTILPLPEGTIQLVSASCCSHRSLICLDESGTLWHVDDETVKIAEHVIDVFAIYDNYIYLCEDGTAYLCLNGSTEVFAKNATEIGFYGDFSWGAVVPEAEANLNYHGKHLWVADNYLD